MFVTFFGALPEISNDVIIREIHNSRLHMESKIILCTNWAAISSHFKIVHIIATLYFEDYIPIWRRLDYNSI